MCDDVYGLWWHMYHTAPAPNMYPMMTLMVSTVDNDVMMLYMMLKDVPGTQATTPVCQDLCNHSLH